MSRKIIIFVLIRPLQFNFGSLRLVLGMYLFSYSTILLPIYVLELNTLKEIKWYKTVIRYSYITCLFLFSSSHRFNKHFSCNVHHQKPHWFNFHGFFYFIFVVDSLVNGVLNKRNFLTYSAISKSFENETKSISMCY